MNFKKTIYIILTMFLGVMLSFIIHSIIEINHINRSLSLGFLLESILGYDCYLPLFLQIILLMAGLIGGYFLGHFWWRIIYINKKT